MSTSISTDVILATVKTELSPLKGVDKISCMQRQGYNGHFVSVQVNAAGVLAEELRPKVEAGLEKVAAGHPDWPELRLSRLFVSDE